MTRKNQQIRTLTASEHIRLRPGMYIGQVNSLGATNLVIEILRLLCENNPPKGEIYILLNDVSTQIKLRHTALNRIFSENAETGLKNITEFSPIGDKGFDLNFFPVLFYLSSDFKLKRDQSDIITSKRGDFNFNLINVESKDWLTIEFAFDSEIFNEIELSMPILRNECKKLAALCNNVMLEMKDVRSGALYHERFTMDGGFKALFESKLNHLNASFYEYIYEQEKPKIFHYKVNEPELSLELAFVLSKKDNSFKNSYYRFLNLTQGGSHTSYFDKRIKKLIKKFNAEQDWDYGKIKSYCLMTNIETKHAFPFVGPTKTRIEDPSLVQIMKKAIDYLEPEIISSLSS